MRKQISVVYAVYSILPHQSQRAQIFVMHHNEKYTAIVLLIIKNKIAIADT